MNAHTAIAAHVVAPHQVDLFVGQEIRRRRKALGVTQEKLAEALGLTFQQVQKYERGTNRVSASKLYQIALTLGCSPADLFPGDGCPSSPLPQPHAAALATLTNRRGGDLLLDALAELPQSSNLALLGFLRSLKSADEA